MNTLIVTDVYLWLDGGRVFAENKAFFVLRRYYDAFGRFSIISRVRTDRPDNTWFDLTDLIDRSVVYHGFGELYSAAFGRRIREEVTRADLVIGRLESFPACRAFDAARSAGKRFFAELMSDPWDGYWNYSLLGKLVAPYAYLKTKQVLKHSDYALYVTQRFLQHRYPCPGKSVGVSNVLIGRPEEGILARRLSRINCFSPGKITLMTTAAVNVRYKGQAYVIRAIPELNRKGIRVEYMIVGEGDRTRLERLAGRLGVSDQVRFCGKVSLEEVFALLDRTDIYIQPSLQEGLPRAVVEAMSRACPCLGARTAGIPELLPERCVFRRRSVGAIVRAVTELLDPGILRRLAEMMYAGSAEYADDILSARRNAYYDYVKSDLAAHSDAEGKQSPDAGLRHV